MTQWDIVINYILVNLSELTINFSSSQRNTADFHTDIDRNHHQRNIYQKQRLSAPDSGLFCPLFLLPIVSPRPPLPLHHLPPAPSPPPPPVLDPPPTFSLLPGSALT